MRSLQGRGKKQTWNVWPLLRYQDPKLCPQQEDDLGHCLSPTPEPPQAPVLLGARVATPCLLQLPHSLIQTLWSFDPQAQKKDSCKDSVPEAWGESWEIFFCSGNREERPEDEA